MSGFTGYIQLVYVLTAALFVVGLHLMNSPATARRGNQVALTGMVIAVIATLVLMIHDGTVTATGWIVLITGALIGSGVGLYAARTVQMTAMPQLVSAFNSVGGGAAALVAIYGYYHAESHAGGVLGTTTVFTVLDVLIGSVTFSGSIIAAGKLQGFIPSHRSSSRAADWSTWRSRSSRSARARSCSARPACRPCSSWCSRRWPSG